MPSKQEDRGRAGVGCGVWVGGVGVGDGAPAELLPRMPKPTARACRDGPYALVFKTIDCSFYRIYMIYYRRKREVYTKIQTKRSEQQHVIRLN